MKIRFLPLLLSSLALAAVALRAADRPPNLLVILVDDMGWADAGHDGSKIDTPAIDRLAQEGTKLTRFYSSAPMCSPTRAALLTGRYPHSVGVPELASPTARGAVPVLALDHNAITIPEALKPAGYHSVMVGKWHLGHAKENWPRTHGFDEFWGSLIGTPQFWLPKETFHNETPIEVRGHYTDRLTEKAIEYLRAEAAGQRPFFLYLAYNAPHYPHEAPAELVYKYRRRFPDRGLFAHFAASVDYLDQGIGRVLKTLDELKLTSNTLVVFTSDNGPSAEITSYGPEGADFSNGPLRGYKFHTHEGGIRVPFLARWPGRIPAGVRRDTPAITMDLLPTLLEAAAVRPAAGQEIHGTSILPLLRDGTPPKRPAALHWENKENAGVLDGEWKLVHRFYEKPHLYRVAEDIGEDHDLAAQNPEKVAALLALHEQWKARYYPHPVPRTTKRATYLFPVTPQDP